MSQSTDSILTSKKTAVLAGASIVVAILFAVAGAHAYPGATAKEIETIAEVKSVCAAVDASKTSFYWFGYKQAGIRVNEKNECPAGYVILLHSVPTIVSDMGTMNSSAAVGYQSYDSNTNRVLNWTTRYSVSLFEGGQRRVWSETSEADFDREKKSLLTASETTPVSFKVNYPANKIEPSERRNFSEYEKVIKVIGTCRMNNSNAVYLLLRPASSCDEGFQFSIYEVAGPHSTQIRNHSEIKVYSQFGLELFSSSLLWGARQKLNTDLRTASPEHPVLVTIDTKNKQVLKIEPSISPYAL